MLTTSGRTSLLLAASVWLAAIGLCACTDASVQPLAVTANNGNDRLELKGQVCTQAPDPTGFPVKVVFIVDQSGSMCISDPPGSQGVPGFCEAHQVIPPGVTEPARVRAMKQLVNQFQSEPNVQVAVVPFETNVKNVWPPALTGSRFARPDGSLIAYLSGLQSQLGKGTDYEGVLAYVYALISSDIAAVQASNPALLPRSRYVIVFLTDGTPYPRCSANDSLPPSSYADPDHPWLIWPDSSSAQDFCNLLDPNSPDNITGFIPGTDRNQNYQLFNYIDRIMALKDQNNIGDIRLHSVLLLNQAAVALCGPICQDIYGTYPNVAPADYPAATKKVATWLLTQMAQRGNGVFQAFLDGEIQNLGLGALNYASFASPNIMKTLLLQSLRSIPAVTKRAVDSDGDGLSDDKDNSFTFKTSPYLADTDGDCFDDNFEVVRADQGFDPAKRDTRGCDPNSPLTLGCRCRDTDGDGLSQFAEAYLKTNAGLVDSDGDGIPDGLEARYRLDPLKPNAATLDTDGDGIPDAAEILAGTDPTQPDRTLNSTEGFQYQATAQPQSDQSVCYTFDISNIGMIDPPSHAGVPDGYNLYKVWFAESPSSGVATDYGVWRAACAWSQYSPPNLRVPAGPDLTFVDSNFLPTNQLVLDTDYIQNCIGKHP